MQNPAVRSCSRSYQPNAPGAFGVLIHAEGGCLEVLHLTLLPDIVCSVLASKSLYNVM